MLTIQKALQFLAVSHYMSSFCILYNGTEVRDGVLLLDCPDIC